MALNENEFNWLMVKLHLITDSKTLQSENSSLVELFQLLPNLRHLVGKSSVTKMHARHLEEMS